MKAEDVLKKAFGQALTKLDTKPLDLEKPVSTLIADDSDWHRTRRGWMTYAHLHEASVGSRTYVLGLGEAEGDYPADPYRSDILILTYEERPEDLVERACRDVRGEAALFERSFLIAMSDGKLEFPKTTPFSLWWEWPSPPPALAPWERLKAHADGDRAYRRSAVTFVREALLGCLARRSRDDIR